MFGLVVASTGWNEKRLRAAGRPIRIIHTHPANHAGYYPGAEQMSLKLLIDADTDAILGAQGVGGAGVDKRIDVIATAIRGGLTASDLADLELAYAPQFGSAKDPVNMLGFIADNLACGATETIQWHEMCIRDRHRTGPDGHRQQPDLLRRHAQDVAHEEDLDDIDGLETHAQRDQPEQDRTQNRLGEQHPQVAAPGRSRGLGRSGQRLSLIHI